MELLIPLSSKDHNPPLTVRFSLLSVASLCHPSGSLTSSPLSSPLHSSDCSADSVQTDSIPEVAPKQPARIVFVTGNNTKIREVMAILDATECKELKSVEIVTQSFDVPELQGTTQEIALAKCRYAAEKLGIACMTEGTSLCFEALGGLPGPYIKHFQDKLVPEGELGIGNASIRFHTLLTGFPSTRATALPTISFCPEPSNGPILFEGRACGQIVMPRGDTPQRWNRIFEPDEGGRKTYAEMGFEERCKISYRFMAMKKLGEYLAGDAKSAAERVDD